MNLLNINIMKKILFTYLLIIQGLASIAQFSGGSSALPITKVKQLVNAGTPVILDNIQVQVPLTAQGRGFEIATVTGTLSASLTGETNYAAGTWFQSQSPATSLTTTFQHPFGWTLEDVGDYMIIRVRSGTDFYKIEIFVGTGYNNNLIVIEKF